MHPSRITAVATIGVEGQPSLLATASSDATIRIWDPRVGDRPIDAIDTGATGTITALAAFVAGDEPTVLAVAHDNAPVQLWELTATGAAARTLPESSRAVTALTTVPHTEAPLLASVNHHEQAIRLWDIATATLVGVIPTGEIAYLTAVTSVAVDDERVLLATGGSDAVVRLWEPRGRVRPGHDAQPREVERDSAQAAVAVTTVFTTGDRTMLASAGYDATVRLWDTETGELIGPPLTGHYGTVTSIISLDSGGGRSLLVTAGNDRSIRLWDPSAQIPGRQICPPPPCHSGSVTALERLQTPTGAPYWPPVVTIAACNCGTRSPVTSTGHRWKGTPARCG